MSDTALPQRIRFFEGIATKNVQEVVNKWLEDCEERHLPVNILGITISNPVEVMCGPEMSEHEQITVDRTSYTAFNIIVWHNGGV